MTPAELRSIDAQVAERVMGWKPHPAQDGTYWVQPEKASGSNWMGFHPTESDADAFAVLRKCAEKTDQISIVECAGMWAISEGDGNDPEAVSSGSESETLPLAISLFALKLWE